MATQKNNGTSGFVEPESRTDAPETFEAWLRDRLCGGAIAEEHRNIILECFAPFLSCEVSAAPLLGFPGAANALDAKEPAVADFLAGISLQLHSGDIAQFGPDGEVAQWIEAVFQFLHRDQPVFGSSTLPKETLQKVRLTLDNLVTRLPVDWSGLFKEMAKSAGREIWPKREIFIFEVLEPSLAKVPLNGSRMQWADEVEMKAEWLVYQCGKQFGRSTTGPDLEVVSRIRQTADSLIGSNQWARLEHVVERVCLQDREFGAALMASGTEERILYVGPQKLLFDQVDSSKPETGGNREALSLWYSLAERLHGRSTNAPAGAVAEETRARLFASAREQLGRMRAVARVPEPPIDFVGFLENAPRAGATVADIPKPKFDWPFYRKTFAVLSSFATRPWEAMKPLLLLFRELSDCAVAPDLRYWESPPKQRPPLRWHEVPASFAALCSASYLADELQRQPDLEDLRIAFSEFCLDRLRSRAKSYPEAASQSSSASVEPNAAWRLAYVRAAQELRVNPRGKGHHLAHWLADNDPDESVRRHAKSLYETLRNHPKLPPNSSPRRALIGAFWWLRQGHLLALNGELDPAGAQSTLRQEMRHG